jgi:tetratricopeptide (TPR) repeat protein
LTSDRREYQKSITSLFILLILAIAVSIPALAQSEFEEKYRAYKNHIKFGAEAFSKKDYPSAVMNYGKAIELSPFEASSYYQRGIALYKLGKYQEGIADFDKVIVLDSRMSTAYTYRGLCRANAGANKEALVDYKRALEFNPKDVSVHNNLAMLYAAAKDTQVQDKLKALEHAVKASEISGEKNAEVLDTLAFVYSVNGKIPEAIEAEKKALNLAPENEGFKKKLQEYEGRLSRRDTEGNKNIP